MDVEIVKISSKGQFVFPLSMRKKFKMGKGEKMMLVENNGTVVMRPVKGMGEDLEEEMYMMQRAALGWSEIDKGNFKRMPKAKFLKELETW
jgi:bifunctional DNA-binding transcriptional regulator/antitoxin component of YhaV-PrlF toxin-antitoxin module